MPQGLGNAEEDTGSNPHRSTNPTGWGMSSSTGSTTQHLDLYGLNQILLSSCSLNSCLGGNPGLHRLNAWQEGNRLAVVTAAVAYASLVIVLTNRRQQPLDLACARKWLSSRF